MAHILLNEFLPAPKDLFEAEWVELYNADATIVDLSEWKIDDGEGGGRPYTLPAGSLIQPGGLLLITLNQSLLNNTGDHITLLSPDGTIVDSFHYTSSVPDQSYSRSSTDRTAWTNTLPPSPGEPNSAEQIETSPQEQEQTALLNLPDTQSGDGSAAAPLDETNSIATTDTSFAADGIHRADALWAGETPEQTHTLRQPASLQPRENVPALPYLSEKSALLYRYSPPPTVIPPATPVYRANPQPGSMPIIKPPDHMKQIRLIAVGALLLLAGGLVVYDLRRTRN